MPSLVTLQGDGGRNYRVDVGRILNRDDYAAWQRAPYLTGDDIAYLERQYPELMGVWATAAVGAGKVLKNIGKAVFGKIAERIRARRAARAGSASGSAAAPVASAPAASAPVRSSAAAMPDARYASAVSSSSDIEKYLPFLIIGGIAIVIAMRK